MAKKDIANALERLAISVELDEDEKLPAPFTYTKSCVSGPGVNLPIEPFYQGCQCNEACVGSYCSFLLQYGPAYEMNNGILTLKDKVYQPTGFHQPVFECNSKCTCSKSCGNRLVQNGISLRLQVFPTTQKGWGLRTLETVAKGQFVCEYAGEVISFSEAKKRTLQTQQGSSNYIIVIKEHVSGNQVLRTHVDPIYHGNAGRFINHSCDPNLVMIPVRVDSLIPILALFALKEIPENSELSFDYSGGNTFQESTEKQTASSTNRRCNCQSAGCSGYLPCDPTLF